MLAAMQAGPTLEEPLAGRITVASDPGRPAVSSSSPHLGHTLPVPATNRLRAGARVAAVPASF
jgi:hypothetical protein